MTTISINRADTDPARRHPTAWSDRTPTRGPSQDVSRRETGVGTNGLTGAGGSTCDGFSVAGGTAGKGRRRHPGRGRTNLPTTEVTVGHGRVRSCAPTGCESSCRTRGSGSGGSTASAPIELSTGSVDGPEDQDAGMSTVEYAVGTIAAAAFAAVLYRIVTGESVVAGLTQLINNAFQTL